MATAAISGQSDLLKMEDAAFVLEQVTLEDSSDDDFDYDAVAVEDDVSDSETEENFGQALRSLNEETITESQVVQVPPTNITKQPEVVEDFLRNFLVKYRLSQTLETFETEWYRYLHTGKIKPAELAPVPDVYQQNLALNQRVAALEEALGTRQAALSESSSTYATLLKERDYHKMHHKRVAQEKGKLMSDLKKLKKHFENYEPALRQLRHKYEAAMKEKMLARLERDRLAARLEALGHQVDSGPQQPQQPQQQQRDGEAAREAWPPATRRTVGADGRARGHVTISDPDDIHNRGPAHPDDSTWPLEMRVNPYSAAALKAAEVHTFRANNTIKAHTVAVAGLALHPTKQLLATVSDDHMWKMWTIPTGELIMTGEGHTDWVGDCDFHPGGGHLATGSGDSTVKVWDFAKAACTTTFVGHTQAVWGVNFHDCGDFLASCSMDHTAKVWDLHSGRCRQTLRGHADSVNCVQFQPCTNNIVTCSGDKTVSLWDGRSGLCAQTFYGHYNSCTSVSFNMRGDVIASSDADGVVRLWDVRMVEEMACINFGRHSANRVAFDPSGSILAVASNDGTVKLWDAAAQSHMSAFGGHEDAVQSVMFSRDGSMLLSASSDTTVRIWSK